MAAKTVSIEAEKPCFCSVLFPAATLVGTAFRHENDAAHAAILAA